jgi:RecA-family ATPase
VSAARAGVAEIIVLDPLYATHDQDENDTRAMAALCQSLLRLRDASRAALVVVHHVRKFIGYKNKKKAANPRQVKVEVKG